MLTLFKLEHFMLHSLLKFMIFPSFFEVVQNLLFLCYKCRRRKQPKFDLWMTRMKLFMYMTPALGG